MSSFFLIVLPSPFDASTSSAARRSAIVFSVRARENEINQRIASAARRSGRTSTGTWSEARDPYLLETSVPGIFACGDVRFSPVKRVASAVGEGSMAIAFVHQYLRDTG